MVLDCIGVKWRIVLEMSVFALMVVVPFTPREGGSYLAVVSLTVQLQQ